MVLFWELFFANLLNFAHNVLLIILYFRWSCICGTESDCSGCLWFFFVEGMHQADVTDYEWKYTFCHWLRWCFIVCCWIFGWVWEWTMIIKGLRLRRFFSRRQNMRRMITLLLLNILFDLCRTIRVYNLSKILRNYLLIFDLYFYLQKLREEEKLLNYIFY